MTNILFRCDGSREIGLGHVVRCLALAGELRDVHDCHITFAMRTGPLGIKMVEEKGYEVLTPPIGDLSFDYREWLDECARNVEAKALVLDVRDGLQRTALDGLRNEGILIVTIDDPEDKRLSTDLAFCLPVPQVKRMDWSGFTGELYVGWEWVVLRKDCTNLPKRKQENERSMVLITMGSSDPAGLTLKAVKSLDLVNGEFDTVVVLGPAFRHHEELTNLLANTRCFCRVCQNSENLPALMAEADLAVASFGVTAYELAAMGIPAIYLCLTEDHAESASVFEQSGMATSLGVHNYVSEYNLAIALGKLLKDKTERSLKTKQCKKLIDGQGSRRIAALIFNKLLSHNARK